MAISEGPPPSGTQKRWCEWCGQPYRQSTTGRTARYCRRSCRQRAYEHRREVERTQVAVHEAERALGGAPRPVPSRDETPQPSPRTPRPARPVSGGEDVPLW